MLLPYNLDSIIFCSVLRPASSHIRATLPRPKDHQTISTHSRTLQDNTSELHITALEHTSENGQNTAGDLLPLPCHQGQGRCPETKTKTHPQSPETCHDYPEAQDLQRPGEDASDSKDSGEEKGEGGEGDEPPIILRLRNPNVRKDSPQAAT